jgi:hypothetical protein
VDMKEELNKYKTTDITLAASLFQYGYTLIGVDFEITSKLTKGIFVFDKVEGLLDLVENYKQDHLSVEPKNFLRILRELKGRASVDIHSAL